MKNNLKFHNFSREHEEAIKLYQGVDPLSVWYDYISWIEQSYPKHGNESPLDEVVLKCIMKFEDDPRYKQDRRMIKLYIKYVSILFLYEDPENYHS